MTPLWCCILRVRPSIAPTRTMAVILIVRNAHVCSKFMTRTITKITACNASGSESKKQYGNQLFHFYSTSMDVPSLDQAELWFESYNVTSPPDCVFALLIARP